MHTYIYVYVDVAVGRLGQSQRPVGKPNAWDGLEGLSSSPLPASAAQEKAREKEAVCLAEVFGGKKLP